MASLLRRIETRIQGFLSHHPILYAIIVGTGIILFWRGVWHSADLLYYYFYRLATHCTIINCTVDLSPTPWWDGPLSILIGFLILLFAGAFVSSFIGNELILAGLRGEKRLGKKTETEVRTEAGVIGEIRQELADVSQKIEGLEAKLK